MVSNIELANFTGSFQIWHECPLNMPIGRSAWFLQGIEFIVSVNVFANS